MAVGFEMVKRNLLVLATVTLLVIVTSNAQGPTCPEPSNLEASNVVYNAITFRWDVTKYIPNPVHCTCMSLGNYGETCSASNTPKVCTTGVAGYTRAQSSLSIYTNYTMCVQTQCSGSNFSTAVCRTFRTSPTAPSQPYQIFATKHSPSSIDVSWRFPTALNGPLDGYRIRWCQTSNCVPSQQILRGNEVRNFRLAGLLPFRQYNVYVCGFNVDPYTGQTLFGTEASLSEYTLPTYPSEPSLSFTKVSTSQVNVVVGVPKYTNGPINGYVLTWCPKLRCYGDNVGTREVLQANAGTQSITGLQPWTEYEVTVRAFNIVPTDSERAYSEEVKGTVVPMPFSPSGPQNFKATPLSSTSMRLTWDLPPRFDVTPTHFRLFWCTGGYRNCFNLDVGNVREAVISPLAPYTEYRFMIKALVQFSSPWLNSAVSSTSVRTWPSDPSRPIELKVVRTKATAVDVSWKAPLDPAGPLAGFRVRICPELGTCPAIGLISRHKTLNKNTTNHSFYGLEPYAKYQVQVRAFNSLPDGKTAEGDVAALAVSTTPSEPSEPTSLAVKTISSTVLLVTWQPPSHKNGPIKGYNVSWWKSEGASTHDVEDLSTGQSNFVAGEATSLRISNLLPYTTYAVRVARVNVDGNTTLEGAAAHAEGITDPEPCPPPTDVTVVAVEINATTSKLTFSWSPPNATVNPPVEGYQIHVCRVENASTCWDANTTAEQRSYAIEAVPNFEDYIVAVNAYVLNHGRVVVGESATTSASTAAPKIPAVTNINATAVNSTSIYVEWKPVASVNELSILYNVTLVSLNGAEVSQVFVSDPTAAFAGLQAWTSYSVQVSACVARGSKRQCGTARAADARTSPSGSSKPTTVRTSTNSTAIHVTWEEPLHPNGPLLGYDVAWWLNNATQNESDDSAQIHKRTVFLEGAVFSHIITELKSAATYVIEIRRVNGENSTLKGAAARVEASTAPDTYSKPEDANFTIQKINATHFAINITWNPPHSSAKGAELERYEVFVQRIEEGKPSVVFTANPVTTEYIFEVANMNPFVEYVVQIRTYARFGNTVVKGEAAEVRVTADARFLLVVSDVEVNSSANGVAVVSWKSSLGVDVASSNATYEVRLISTETGEEIEGTVVSSLQATFTGLKLRTNYTARVKACDVRGHVRKCGDVSEARFRTPKEDITPRPTDFTVVAVNSTALKVTWQMPELSHGVDVTEYRILWWPSIANDTSASAENGHTGIHVANWNESTFIISGLEAYKNYDVEIVVFYVEGTMIKNVSLISRSKTAPKAFAPPVRVTFDISGGLDNLTRVNIAWQPPTHLTGPSIEGYYVDVCPIVTSSKSQHGVVCKRHNTTSTTFVAVLEGLNKFEAYTVFVSAYAIHQGVVIIGNPKETFVTIDPTPQLKVEGLKFEAVGNDSLRISWTGVDLSASRWSAVYTVKAIRKSTGDQVFEKEVTSTEVIFPQLNEEEYTIHVEACIVRGGVKHCGKPNAASVQPSGVVQDEQLVKIETVNSSAVAIILSHQAQMETSLAGVRISWSTPKRFPNDTLPGKRNTVFLPINTTSFVITDLGSFEIYNIEVAKVFIDGTSQWETVVAKSEAVTDPKPLPKPTEVAYQSSSSGNTSSLIVNWNAPNISSGPSIEGYIVSICPREEILKKTGGCQTFNTSESSLLIEVSGLRSFSEYVVEITAYATSNGRVIKGNIVRIVAETSPPPIPAIESPVLSKAFEGTTVNISWMPPPALTDYDVVYEVVLTEEASGLILFKGELNTSETTLQNLETSTDYTVSITVCLVSGARRKCGNSSATLFKTASKDVPKEPIHLHIKAINSSALVITWPLPLTNATPFESYRLTWWKEQEAITEEASVHNESLPADSTRFVIDNLEANSTYHVNVSRIYQGNEMDRTDSEQISASTQPDPYVKPNGLHVEYNTNSSEVTVTWEGFPVRLENSPVRQYVVKLCLVNVVNPDQEHPNCERKEISAGVEKAVFTGISSLADYRVEVRAIVSRGDNTTDEGEPAVEYFDTPAPPVPDLRHKLRADLNATRVTLHWSEPAGVNDYEILYYVNISSASTKSEMERTTNLTELTFDGLEPSTNYSADVATCLVGRQRRHCAGNTTIEFKTLPIGFQGDVTNLTAEAVSGTSLRISWDAPVASESLKGYRVSWWLHHHNQTRRVDDNIFTVSLHSTSKLIDRLQPYTTYVVEVIADYEASNVMWHGKPLLQSATTKPDGLPAVANVDIGTTNRNMSSSDVVISWTTTNIQNSSAEVMFRVILCIESNAGSQNCFDKSVNAPISKVMFAGVKNFAALVAKVQPLVKTENKLYEGKLVKTTGVSWTPEILDLSELTVADITENSAHVSWLKAQDFDEVSGAYYRVVLSVEPSQNVVGNTTILGTDSYTPMNGNVSQQEIIIVRNITTADTEIELGNLKAWRHYTVTVTPTVVGEGKVFVGEGKRKDFETLVGVPEKPRNVTLEEKDGGHTLTWLPPESWNGPPGGYEVSFTCMNGEVKGNSTSVSLEADRMALRIPTLSPGVPCTVSINAYNLYEDESQDGARVRVRFTPLGGKKDYAAFDHPTIN
ncbi:uncharacterized protein [Dermacentor andersoni]|uniref:uncharacterized protein isoform X1 n=1 Tax=Dermacentor andersoni TaxID=34620 RepID=UPI002155C1BC|nr:phosphatidylinositol phosphatase PTPRQ-like isoform X1 [Dermacentor andersoni]